MVASSSAFEEVVQDQSIYTVLDPYSVGADRI